MNLIQYLTKHDGRLLKDGAELTRIAKRAGASKSHTYLCALGLKHPSRELAIRYAKVSKSTELDVGSMMTYERPAKRKR